MAQTYEEFFAKQKARNSKWQKANKEKVSQYQREYYHLHKDKLRLYRREWRKKYISRLKAESDARKATTPDITPTTP